MNELAIRALAERIYAELIAKHEGDFRDSTLDEIAGWALDAARVFAQRYGENRS